MFGCLGFFLMGGGGLGTKLWDFIALEELNRQPLFFFYFNFATVAAVDESVVFHTESDTLLIQSMASS